MSGVVLIIPALDEQEAIGHVLADVPPGAVDRIVVVDNGSRDGTAAAAAKAGADVVVEPRRGYGNACRAGVRAAPEAQLFVFLDGDGSFDPREIPSLLAPIKSGTAELVLGSRELGATSNGALPPHQRWGNRLVAALLRTLYGLHITDIGPFRAIDAQLLRELEMREPTYGWPTEMVVKAARRARIVEVPVSYRSRLGGVSKVGGTVRGTLLAGYRMLALTFRYARKDGR